MKTQKIHTIIKLSSYIFSIITIIFPTSFAYAQTLDNPLTTISTFQCFVSEILKIVMQIGLPVVVLAIIYSGFLFVTAQGNEEKLKTARSAFTWSVIGGAVLLGSWALAVGIGDTISAIGGSTGTSVVCP
jgi:hypothetical protein